MDFIINYWHIIIAAAAVIAAAIFYGVHFSKLPPSAQIAKVREWLLYAVTEAEKELGGGTGKLKLRYVYDMFISKFPWLVKVTSFELFSSLVDDALDEMRELLKNNTAVKALVKREVENNV